MKFVSWNVNGYRSVLTKGFKDIFDTLNADIFCIQETKMQEMQADTNFDGYYTYMNSAQKKGYSGTAVFTKQKPVQVIYGLGKEKHDLEGRVITLEYENFFLVNCYTPNSKKELERLEYRMEWEDEMRNYLIKLDQIKPVIYCGDLNVAHQEIDIKNPKTNHRSAGFTDEEREKMTLLLESNFLDSFRYLYPDKKEVYSWWSYMRQAREKNIGWRIDYFIVSKRLKDQIQEATIYTQILGSDHCPIGLELK